MIQSNETLADVMWIWPDPDGMDDLDWHATTSCAWKTQQKYIRHGAATEWIDPKVQPIPEGLADDRLLHIEFIYINGAKRRVTLEAGIVRRIPEKYMLLGYVILPP